LSTLGATWAADAAPSAVDYNRDIRRLFAWHLNSLLAFRRRTAASSS
jgi:hypothetical protein